MEPIEKHADFRLTKHGAALIDPETRESGEITLQQIADLQDKSNMPVRDFAWQTSGKKTLISQMDPEFLLVAARHCVHRREQYFKNINFFVDVLEIIEDHATVQGIEIPDTVEGIQTLIEELKNSLPITEPEKEAMAPTPSSAITVSPDVDTIKRMAASIHLETE